MEQQLLKSQRCRTSAALFLVSFFCLTTSLFAQDVDQRLWALWEVEAIDVKLPAQNARRFDLQTLLAQPAFQSLSSTMFISLYFFDNNVGVNIQNPPPNVSLKGTFATSGNQLTITMQDNRKYTFSYRFDAEKLVITQTILTTEISIIFNAN
ncbi:MAG: hypothetical protein LBS05_10340 [Tannerellaceae bacterium]|jgi:hypothetical protein|nr:hypothetical protein [Tannerellaceae bacterium]